LKQQIKTVLTFGILAALVIFAIGRLKHSRGGEAGARVWFYDQQAKRLYPAPRDLISPDGDADTRVRAIVIGFQGLENDVSQLKIAYLEKYSPDYKALLQRAAAAHAAKRPFDEKIPAQGGAYYGANTFVKLPEETSWHNISDPEARQIMAEWHQFRGPTGQSPIISVPSPD
jgi:hypothetical protein